MAPGILEFDDKLIQELIDFDEIIPISYTVDHYKDFPLPINISYYNEGNSLRLINDDYYNEGINLDTYCLANKTINHPKYRRILSDRQKWTLGHPNMVQATLHDILCQKPKKCKVFGMNFFLSNQPYHKGYKTNLSKAFLSSHNIISNFLYIKKLFSERLIELDYIAEQIILGGVENYCKEMSKIYSRFY